MNGSYKDGLREGELRALEAAEKANNAKHVEEIDGWVMANRMLRAEVERLRATLEERDKAIARAVEVLGAV